MRVLVTGSNGLLGQKMVERLVGLPDVEVVATSLHENQIPDVAGYVFQRLDITSLKQCGDTVDRFSPDVIINTAAISQADYCEQYPLDCDRLNVEAVKNLVSVANGCGAHLIHLSTDFVFDGENGPYGEKDAPRPLSCYGQSKLSSEKWIQDNAHSWAIVRTVQVYGVNSRMSRSNLVLWVKKSLEQEQVIHVVDDQIRTPTLVEDLAEGIFRILSLGAQGVFHVSGGELLSVYEIAQRVAAFFGLQQDLIRPISTHQLKEKAKRPLRTGFVIEKAREQLGYRPRSLEVGLSMVGEQLKNFAELNRPQ